MKSVKKKKRYKRRKRPNTLFVLIILVIISGTVLVLLNREPQNDGSELSPTTSGTENPDNSSISTENTTTEKETSPTPEPSLEPTPTVQPTEAAAQQPVLTATPEPTQSPTPAPTPAGSSEVSAEPSKNMEELKKDLIEYIAKQDGKYGLYFINLVTGEEFGINDRDEYIAASTTKLPMNLLLYKKVESGEVDLNSKLVYLEEDFEAGTGIIQDTPYGTEYTVRETARLSIVYSDNCGINMIIRLLGIENIREYMQELGGTIYYGKRHRSCPYDLALYAQELYRFYQESPDVAGMLIEDLQNTKWNDRINKLLPAHVKVAHKIGTYPGACNDVGIVFATQPYVLAVMSDKVEYGAATNVIAELSRKIYDYVER